MPGLKVHNYITRLIFGKSYLRVHRAMDGPFRTLGKKHRILYHDPWTACAIARALYPFDVNAEKAALWHILVDYLCSRNPALKRGLERLAESHGRKKKRRMERKARIRRSNSKERLISDLTRLIRRRILTG